MESAGFILEGHVCPAGYILQTDDSPSVCICNDDISDVLLCKDDQETVVIKVNTEIISLTCVHVEICMCYRMYI